MWNAWDMSKEEKERERGWMGMCRWNNDSQLKMVLHTKIFSDLRRANGWTMHLHMSVNIKQHWHLFPLKYLWNQIHWAYICIYIHNCTWMVCRSGRSHSTHWPWNQSNIVPFWSIPTPLGLSIALNHSQIRALLAGRVPWTDSTDTNSTTGLSRGSWSLLLCTAQEEHYGTCSTVNHTTPHHTTPHYIIPHHTSHYTTHHIAPHYTAQHYATPHTVVHWHTEAHTLR